MDEADHLERYRLIIASQDSLEEVISMDYVSHLWGLDASKSLKVAWIRESVPLSRLAVASSSAMITASFNIALQSLHTSEVC